MIQPSTSRYHLVLDASGSMSGIRLQTLNALNEQLKAIQNIAAANPETPIRVSLTLFNTSGQKLFSNLSPDEIRLLHQRQYRTDGGTALLDAMGLAIADTEAAMRGDDDAVLIVLTDGEENSSQFYTYRQIAKKIRALKSTERWTFTFLGADIDAWAIASQLSFNQEEVRTIRVSEIPGTLAECHERMDRYIQRKKSGIRTGFMNDPD